MTLEEELALVMAEGKKELAPDLQALLTASVAWSLSKLLVAWSVWNKSDKSQPAPAPLLAVFKGLNSYVRGPLERMIAAVQAPSTLSLLARMRGLVAQFVVVIESIGGANTLRMILAQPDTKLVLNEILRVYPIPSSVSKAFGFTEITQIPLQENRIHRFDGFDRPPPETKSPKAIRAILADATLDPAERWQWEQTLQEMGVAMYTSDEQAGQIWSAVLKQDDLPEELADYYLQNLSNLGVGYKSKVT